MIRIEKSQYGGMEKSPEELFRELHRNNADILDRLCAAHTDDGRTLTSLEAEVRQLNALLISTYGIATAEYEGEFDMAIEGKGTLHVKFYSTGFMEISLL